jgi:anaerobic selenocysteine-containing dehydrogenase
MSAAGSGTAFPLSWDRRRISDESQESYFVSHCQIVMSTEVRHGYCAPCISRCGCVGTLVDGILTRVDPDPAHPAGQALCVKVKAAPEAVYAPDRIHYGHLVSQAVAVFTSRCHFS